MKTLYTIFLFLFTTFYTNAQFGAFVSGGLDLSGLEKNISNKIQNELNIGVSFKVGERLKLNMGLGFINDIFHSSSVYQSGLTFSMQDPKEVKYQIVDRGRYDTRSIFISPQFFLTDKLSIEPQFYLAQANLNTDFNVVLFTFGTIEETVLQSTSVKKTHHSKLFFRSALRMAYTIPISSRINVSAYGKFLYDFNPDNLDTKTIEDYDFEFRDDPAVIDFESRGVIFTTQKFHIFSGIDLEYLF